MNRLFFLLFILINCSAVIAQAQKENNIWYFGNRAGLDFNSGNPVPLTDGMLNTDEGCSSIADANGNLLFYTDGILVYNKRHQIMYNGTGLMGDPTSSQSGLIVPQPGSSTLYYIFTTDRHGRAKGLRYSVVDMNTQNGLGSVTTKNILLHTPVAEKVTAVKHANNTDYWIVSHKFNSADFIAYLVTGAGLSTTPVTSTIGSVYTGLEFNAQGYLKVSPNGRKLASAVDMDGFFEVFDFNSATGAVTNPIKIFRIRPYGVEFSADSRLLYISTWSGPGAIYQFDLQHSTAANMDASADTIWQGGSVYYTSALQLGPDGKIYVAVNWTSYLHVINKPEVIGKGCNFMQNAIQLSPGISNIGLPNFIQSGFAKQRAAFSYKNSCFGNPTTFETDNIAADSVRWDFGDPASGTANSSTLLNPTHTFTSPGVYQVRLSVYESGVRMDYDLTVNIEQFTLSLGNNTTICPGEELILHATLPNAAYLWQDNSTSSAYTVTKPGTYSVKVTLPCGTLTDTIMVIEDCKTSLVIPNIITPNQDGINDKLVPSSSHGIIQMQTTIFNRWGSKIYNTDNVNIEWDGALVPDGIYYWHIIYTDRQKNRHTLKGWVEVIR